MLGPVLLAYSLLLLYAVLYGPFPALVPLGSPTAYRNLYIHVPQSIAALLMALISFFAALWFLKKRGTKSRSLMHKSAVLAAAFSWLSFITGTVWAQESWGSAWSGDPRQLSVAVMAVLYTGYIILRRGVEDPDRADRVSAAYLALAFVSVPITLIAPVLIPALHPPPGTLAELAAPIRAIYIAVLLALLTAAALILAGFEAKTAWGVAAMLILFAAAVLVLMPYSQPVYRVYNATISGSAVTAITNGGVLTIPVEKITLRPLDINGKSTLAGHLITKDGVVVTHWSVAVNLLVTSAALLILTRLSNREI
ncbi:MAG: cytochrome c biogenesis protein CcsA [Pyrobaculum sp.]